MIYILTSDLPLKFLDYGVSLHVSRTNAPATKKENTPINKTVINILADNYNTTFEVSMELSIC